MKLADLTYCNKALSFEEKEAIERQKRDMISCAGGCCTQCHKPFNMGRLPQMSHITPKWKGNIEIFGLEVIHHRFNIKITCDKCNSGVMIHTSQKELLRNHLEPIYLDLGVEDYQDHPLWSSVV